MTANNDTNCYGNTNKSNFFVPNNNIKISNKSDPSNQPIQVHVEPSMSQKIFNA